MELIEKIYLEFSRYRLNNPITGCYCGVCLTEEFNNDIQKIPLRNISCASMNFYLSAVGITDDNCNDFRYFLPRILEIIQTGLSAENDLFYIWNVFYQIDFSNWEHREIKLVEEFFRRFWIGDKFDDEQYLVVGDINEIKKIIFESRKW